MGCRMKTAVGVGVLLSGLAFAGYNDLGPYSNTESNAFWNLRGHAEVAVSSDSAVCACATFNPKSFVRMHADGCDVRFTPPGLVIVIR